MAQNVTARNQVAQRRGTTAGVTLVLVVALSLAAVVMAIGFLSPTRLAMPQEYVLAAMHGGIATIQESAKVECALPDADGMMQATTRFTRTIIFRDTTMLVVTFDNSPAPTALQCNN